MKTRKKVALLGIGLLGGSVGLRLKKHKLAQEVVGHFRNKKKISWAVRKGIIDRGTTDLADAVRGADIIVISTPIRDIEHKLSVLKKIADPNTLITDTGSTKVSIVRAASGLNFVGAHPLAGSERSGAEAARSDLFKDSICILTPGRKTAAWRKIAAFWSALGCRVYTMKAARHDAILSRTSHLPHVAAFALMAAIPKDVMPFSAGGLRDATRIALSPPELWVDILLANQEQILKALATYERSLSHFKKALSARRRSKILALLTSGQHKRQSLK